MGSRAPVTPALPAQEAGGSQADAAGTPDTQAVARPPGLWGPTPGARHPRSAPGERHSLCAPPEGRDGKGSRGRKSLLQVEGQGQAAPPSGCPLGRGGGHGRLPWRAPARVVYIPGVSFKPGAEAGSRPSPAAPGQSPVKICWRTIARKAAAPRPRPRCSRAGSLPSAPRPLPAGMASWTDVPGEGATCARCLCPRRRSRAPHCFLPSLDTRNVKQAPRAHPHPSSSPSPSPAPQPLPLPASHSPGAAAAGDEEEERTRGNYFRICNARAHTRTSSLWAPLLAGAAPSRHCP